jgi:hypothetical protein
MLGVMLTYTINKDASGVTLTCNKCLHVVRVNEFDGKLGSPRTQAASAMLKHTCNEHGKEPIGKHLPQVMERWY